MTLLLPNSQLCILALVGLPIVLLTNFFDHEHKMVMHKLDTHVEAYETAAPQSCGSKQFSSGINTLHTDTTASVVGNTARVSSALKHPQVNIVDCRAEFFKTLLHCTFQHRYSGPEAPSICSSDYSSTKKTMFSHRACACWQIVFQQPVAIVQYQPEHLAPHGSSHVQNRTGNTSLMAPGVAVFGTAFLFPNIAHKFSMPCLPCSSKNSVPFVPYFDSTLPRYQYHAFPTEPVMSSWSEEAPLPTQCMMFSEKRKAR